MRMRNLLLAALFLGLGAGTASATTIQYHVSFGAGNFTSDPTGGVSPTLILGSFNVNLDIGNSVADTSIGISNTTINGITVDSPWSFTYDSTNDILVVGGSAAGACCVVYTPTSTNDFYMQIHDFSVLYKIGRAHV